KVEWTIDFDRFAHVRLGGLEDWLLVRRLAILFGAAASLCAVVTALVIPSFEDAGFALAYAVLAIATICFALLPIGRAATVMKFETGPRFLEIPRLPQVFRLAATLVLPCLLLQIGYPLKIVFAHRVLTAEDVKPTQDLVRL